MFEDYDGYFESGRGVMVHDNDQIIGQVLSYPYRDGTFVHYLGYVKDGELLRPDQNPEEIRKMKLRYPKLGLELMRWARKNLEPPYYAAFANQELRRVLKAEPTGEVIPPEETGEPEDVSIDRLRVSAFIIEAATYEETVEFLKNTDLKEGSKYDKRYPGVIPALIKDIEEFDEDDNVKWALRNWVAMHKRKVKKRIDPLLNARWEEEQAGNSEQVETLDRRIKETLEAFSLGANDRKRELELLGEVKPLLDRYNIAFDWEEAERRGLSLYRSDILASVAQREEERRRLEKAKELAKDGYLWEGEPVYEFDNGWAIWEIDGELDAETEGDLMQHCIGDPHFGHCTAIDDQRIRGFSLRDEDQMPKVTITFSPDLMKVGEAYAKSDHPVIPEYQDMISEWLKTEQPNSEWFTRKKEGERTGIFSGLAGIGGEDDEEDIWDRPEDWERRTALYGFTPVDVVEASDLAEAVSAIEDNLSEFVYPPDLYYGTEVPDDEEPIYWEYSPMDYSIDSESLIDDLVRTVEDPKLSYEELVGLAHSFAVLMKYEWEADMDPRDREADPVFNKLLNRVNVDGDIPVGLDIFLEAADYFDQHSANLSIILRHKSSLVEGFIAERPDPRLPKGTYAPIKNPTIEQEEPSLEWRMSQDDVEIAQLQALRQAIIDWDLDALIQAMNSIEAVAQKSPIDPLRSALQRIYRAMSYVPGQQKVPNEDGVARTMPGSMGYIQKYILPNIENMIKARRMMHDAPRNSELFGENQLTLARRKLAASLSDLDQSYMFLMQDVTDDLYAIQSSARIGAWDQARAEFEQIVDTLRNLAPDILSEDLIFLLQDLQENIHAQDADEVLKVTPLLLYIFEGDKTLYDYQQG